MLKILAVDRTYPVQVKSVLQKFHEMLPISYPYHDSKVTNIWQKSKPATTCHKFLVPLSRPTQIKGTVQGQKLLNWKVSNHKVNKTKLKQMKKKLSSVFLLWTGQPGVAFAFFFLNATEIKLDRRTYLWANSFSSYCYRKVSTILQ